MTLFWSSSGTKLNQENYTLYPLIKREIKLYVQVIQLVKH